MIQVNYAIGHQGNDRWHYRPNSAGGCSVKVDVKNLSTKTIKYYTLYFIPYNAVKDAVNCNITGVSKFAAKGTGPLAQNSVAKNLLLENAWYNSSITDAKLVSADIEYMDGSKETIPGNLIAFIPSKGGCYVATAVYGSYDCPQVWTLRRYRDNTLAANWFGRAFIHTYYAISPTLVKWFGHTEWFKKLWKGKLDRIVANLNTEGVEDTPYEDKNW